jgi:hypothetical protein
VHYAASNGHLRVFQKIVDKFNEWNPKDIEDYIPEKNLKTY